MKFFGAAQALKPVEQDARVGQFGPLQGLLDTRLRDGGQKPGLGRRRSEPAALVTKVQLAKLHQHGGAKETVRVAVHLTRPHLDRSGRCAPCGVVSGSSPASAQSPTEGPGALRSSPPPRARAQESDAARAAELGWEGVAAAESCAVAH